MLTIIYSTNAKMVRMNRGRDPSKLLRQWRVHDTHTGSNVTQRMSFKACQEYIRQHEVTTA